MNLNSGCEEGDCEELRCGPTRRRSCAEVAEARRILRASPPAAGPHQQTTCLLTRGLAGLLTGWLAGLLAGRLAVLLAC